MTEPTTPLTAPSPSENLFGFFRRLHPMTRFLIAVTIVRLIADLIVSFSEYSGPRADFAVQQGLAGIVYILAAQTRNLTYSLAFLGSAATIEFMFRIWEELKVRRRAT